MSANVPTRKPQQIRLRNHKSAEIDTHFGNADDSSPATPRGALFRSPRARSLVPIVIRISFRFDGLFAVCVSLRTHPLPLFLVRLPHVAIGDVQYLPPPLQPAAHTVCRRNRRRRHRRRLVSSFSLRAH